MINHKLTASLFACFSLFLCTNSYAQKAPTFTLPGINKTINLAEFKGKVVYLDFWASWCDPCRKSFPWMNDMHTRYGSKNFAVVAINLDSSKSDADKFLQKVPAKFHIAYDPDGSVAAKYKLKAMPSSYLIDKDGSLVYSHKGYKEGDVNEIENKIQKLLKL